MSATLDEAFAAWGTHDGDEPFSLFAEVHPRRGPCGHTRRWASTRGSCPYASCRAALNDPRLSKDLPAASPWAARSWPRACPALRSRGTCSWSTRPITRGCAAWSRPRSRCADRRPSPRVQPRRRPPRRVAARADTAVDLVASFAFPLPFTVICELLGVPDTGRGRSGRELTALVAPTSTPDGTPREGRRLTPSSRDADRARRREARRSGDDLVTALIHPRRRRTPHQQELLSTIFQLIVAGHDTTASLIENSVVALCGIPSSWPACVPTPRVSAAVEELLRYDAPVSRTRRSATRLETASPSPASPSRRRAGHRQPGVREPGRSPLLLPGARHRSDPTAPPSPSDTASTSASARPSRGGTRTSRSTRSSGGSRAPTRRPAEQLHWSHGRQPARPAVLRRPVRRLPMAARQRPGPLGPDPAGLGRLALRRRGRGREADGALLVAVGLPAATDQRDDTSMINLDDPEHQKQRMLVARQFTPRAVKQLEDYRAASSPS